MKYIFRPFYRLILIAIIFVAISCGGGGGSGGAITSKPDQAKDFNKSTLIPALQGSILTIPQNVQLVAESSSGKKSKLLKSHKAIVNNGLGENIYGSITATIKYSDEIKNNIIEFLTTLFEDKDLSEAELGTLIETEQGIITGYKLEDISSESEANYNWKLSLYFRFMPDPEIVCKFSFLNGKMKGQMLQSFSETSSVNVSNFDRFFTKYYYFDIRFDGTVQPQILEIDYKIDLSGVIRIAEQYWPQLTDEQWETLDVGQTGNAKIRVQFDGIEYGISGSNYAPGATTKSNLRREVKLFGEDRSTYSFRAKSITGVVDGAKMEVALPVDTLEDVSSIWDEDSFSVLFQNEILDFLNSYIIQLVDSTDDEFIINADYLGTAILNSVDFDGTILEEQRIGFEVLYLYLGNKIAISSLSSHGEVISDSEFDEAVNFWGSAEFTDFNLTSLAEVNAYLSSTDIAITLANKEEVFYRVMAPSIIAYYQENSSDIIIADVERVLESVNDSDSINFNALIATNKLIVNPAFFEKETGLLGTFDGSNFNAYDWFSDTLSVGEKPSNFDVLNALDLTDLETIIPNEVYNLEIEVK